MGEGDAVRIDGARRLRQTLRRAGADMRQLRDANREVAGIVVSAAGARVPHGATGKLAASVRPGATQTAAIARAGNNRSGGVPYANPIHWGWYARHIRSQPFLSLAAQASEPTWWGVLTDRLETIIDSVQGA